MTGVVVSLAPLETGGSLKCGVTPAVQLKRQARGFLNPTTVKVARCGSRESTLLNQRVKRRVNYRTKFTCQQPSDETTCEQRTADTL